MNGLPSGDYVFKYIDRDDIERVRQRILQRRKFQLLNNVRDCEMQIQRETINASVECDLIEKCQSEEKPDDNVEEYAAKLHDSYREEKQKTPAKNLAKQVQTGPVENGNVSKGTKKIFRSSNQPPGKETKIVVKSSTESIESNDNLLIRLTSYQQSIDAKLDEIIPELTKIKIVDGSLEMQKYEKKFADHLKVFSRNYLYQIECIISEIQQPLTYHDFTAKVFSLYELIHHGVNSIVRNLKMHFVGTKVPEKLSKLLSCIQEATKLCVHFDFFDRQDSIVVSLLAKVNKIQNQINGFDEIRRKKLDRPERPKSVPRILLAGRLSMYGSEKQMTKRKFKGRSTSKVRGIHNKAQIVSTPIESTGQSDVLVEQTLIPI